MGVSCARKAAVAALSILMRTQRGKTIMLLTAWGPGNKSLTCTSPVDSLAESLPVGSSLPGSIPS